MSHFYEKLNDGKVVSRHEVEMSSRPGEFRPTRITDVRKWTKEGRSVVPSVTTIQGVLDKEALNRWKEGIFINAAYELNPSDYETVEDWNKAVREKGTDQMSAAPDAGTDFHANMEAFIKRELDLNHPQFDLCRDVGNLIFDKTGKEMTSWQSEINVFSDLGYAGQCDLFIPREFDSQDAHSYVIDFKTKQFKEGWKPKKMAYWDSHLSQLMAYGMELDISCQFIPINIFVCLETQEIEWQEWTDEKKKTKAWEYFLAALNVFQVKNEL